MPSNSRGPNKALRTLRIYFGRTVRDIRRQIGNDENCGASFLAALPGLDGPGAKATPAWAA